MTPKRVKGKRTVRLHAPDVRRLEEAGMVCKQIAVLIDDLDEIEQLQNLDRLLAQVASTYSKADDKPQDEQQALPLGEAKGRKAS